MVRGLFIDEAHMVAVGHPDILFDKFCQGMPGHWDEIRPDLIRDILSVKVHMVRNSPICALTATMTPAELSSLIKSIGRRVPPLLVAQGPIQSNSKISFIRRPSSDVPLLGKRQADGSFKPGDLAILRVLVLDQFMDAVRRGTLSSFPKAVVFFR